MTSEHVERLTRRYRRLLGSYPREHRDFYGDEMIGVLMSKTTPDQGRIDPREAVSLIGSGLRQRLRAAWPASYGPHWRGAVAAFAFLAATALAAMSGYAVAASLAPAPEPFPFTMAVSKHEVTLAVGWTLVAVSTRIGRLRLAAAIAALSILVQVVAIAGRYDDDPSQFVTYWWQVVLAGTVAAALAAITLAGSGDRAPALDLRPTIAVAIAAALAVLAPIVESELVVVTATGPNSSAVSSRLPFWIAMPGVAGPAEAIAVLGQLIVLVMVVLRLRPPLRRRVVLLSLPTASIAALVAVGFGGFLASSPRFTPPVHLVAPQWTALTALPLLTFAMGLWLLTRYERKLASGALLG
jgi:hypothetical protein